MQQKHHNIFLHYHLKYIRLLTAVLLTKNLIFCHVPTWYWPNRSIHGMRIKFIDFSTAIQLRSWGRVYQMSLSIFGTTESKSHASNLDDDVPTWSLKDHVGTLGLRTISVRSKSKCIKKSIKHPYFVHLFRFPAKNAWKCEKNTIFGKWYHVVTFAI